jgi:hypothetical protein
MWDGTEVTPMKLLTKEVIKRLPALYAQESNPDPEVIVKFFNPTGSGTWYVIEAVAILHDGREVSPCTALELGLHYVRDWLFFGLAEIHEKELGYFTLSELQSVRLPFGLGIERDMYFGKHTLNEFRG